MSRISYPDYRDFRDKNRTFEGLVASSFAPFGFSPNATALPKVSLRHVSFQGISFRYAGRSARARGERFWSPKIRP